MKLKMSSLLLMAAVLFIAFACGGSDSNLSKEKTISGVALKVDGSIFSANAKVIAVDESGNTAEGTVDANGNYQVKLVASASSGKKSKDLSGNTFVRVIDGSNSVDIVIPHDQTKVNVNAITSAASGLALGNVDIDLDAIFDAADDANGKKYAGEISNAGLLAALAKVQALTQELFKNNAKTIAGALFGYDEDGNPVVSPDKLINGGVNEKEVTLIKAAAAVSSNLIADAINKANDPTNDDFLFNDSSFFEALGKELASSSNSTTFSSFLNDVVKSTELKDALKELSTELNAYVAAVKENANTSFEVVIPTVVVPADNVIVTASLSGSDVITYSVAGGKQGDSTVTTLTVLSGASVEAVVTAKLTATSDTALSVSDVKVIVDNVVVSVSLDSSTTTGSSFDLAAALAKAKEALAANSSTSSVNVPTTTEGLTLYVNSSVIVRGGKVIPTFIKVGSNEQSSVTGVQLK